VAARGRKRKADLIGQPGARLQPAFATKHQKLKEGVLPRTESTEWCCPAYSINGMAIVHSNAQAW
jgi:hypothetical protein